MEKKKIINYTPGEPVVATALIIENQHHGLLFKEWWIHWKQLFNKDDKETTNKPNDPWKRDASPAICLGMVHLLDSPLYTRHSKTTRAKMTSRHHPSSLNSNVIVPKHRQWWQVFQVSRSSVVSAVSRQERSDRRAAWLTTPSLSSMPVHSNGLIRIMVVVTGFVLLQVILATVDTIQQSQVFILFFPFCYMS